MVTADKSTELFAKFRSAASVKTTDRLVVSAWGLPKCGKTTFVVGNEKLGISHWPLPIFILNFDQGLNELLPHMNQDARELTFLLDMVANNPFPTSAQVASGLREAENWIIDALSAIKEYGNGTIAIDTATHYWQWVQAVELHEIEQKRQAQDKKLFPFDYAKANTRFRHFILQMKASGANIVLLHHARQLYDASGQAQDRYIPQDNSQIEALVQVQVNLKATELRDKAGQITDVLKSGEVQFCRHNDMLRGRSIPNMDYGELYQLIFEREPASV